MSAQTFTAEEVIEKAIASLQPITYEPFDTAYYVTIDGRDEGGEEYCKNCIDEAVKSAKKFNSEMREQIKNEYKAFAETGIWRGNKQDRTYTPAQINAAMKRALKGYLGRANFSYEGHDPDFGGGLHEHKTCSNCGECFTCEITPDMEQAEYIQGIISHAEPLTERDKWIIELTLNGYQYAKDDIKAALLKAAEMCNEILNENR